MVCPNCFSQNVEVDNEYWSVRPLCNPSTWIVPLFQILLRHILLQLYKKQGAWYTCLDCGHTWTEKQGKH